ncbi:MAG: tetratricopeptide repeat protein, partial [Lentisphaerota bacterium]
NQRLLSAAFGPQIQALQTRTNDLARPYILKEYSRCINNAGVTLRMLKRDDLARKCFEQGLEIWPRNPSALMNLRDVCLVQAGELPPKSAKRTELMTESKALLERAFEEAKVLGPVYQDPILLSSQFGTLYSAYFGVLLAQRSRALGMADLEASAVEQAQMISPDNPIVRNSSALFAFGRGNLTEAGDLYHKLLEEDPGNISARIGLAAINYSQQNLPGALALLEDAEAPTNSPDINSFRTLIYLEQKDKNRGLALFEKTAASSHRSALSSAFMALSAYQLDKDDEAEKFGIAALAAAPYNTPILQMLYTLAQKKGNQESALLRLEQWHQADPKNQTVSENLLLAYLRKGDSLRARETATALLEAQPGNMTANMALYSMSELPETQEKYLRNAIKNKNHWLYSKAANNLAYCLYEQNRSEEAKPLAMEAVALEPSNDKFHHTLGSIYLALGDIQKAEEEVQLASTLAPTEGNHRLLLAEIYMAKGDPFKARELATSAMPALNGAFREKALEIIKKTK